MTQKRRIARRHVLLAGSLLLLVGILTGCFGPWFTSVSTPKLYLGEPAVSDGQGVLRILVTDMPNGGLAGIQVNPGGLLYDQEKVSDLVVEGHNGFVVLTRRFADGEGGFILVNTTGVESGAVLELAFEAHGNVKHGDIRLTKSVITLVDDALLPINDWETPEYYAQ